MSAQSTTRALTTGAAGIAVLCAMDGVIKHLVATNDALVVTLGRYVFGAGFALLIWLRSGKPALTAERWRAHALRGVVIAIAATLFFWSLGVLPLAELIVISFIAPLIMPFMARAVLGEKLRLKSIIAVAAGFVGVLVASLGAPSVRSDEMHMLGIAAAVASAVTYALSLTLLRGRAGKDGAAVVGLLGSIIPGAIVALPALATGEAPPASDLPAFALMGGLAAGGIWLYSSAYAHAEAQRMAPLEYTALIWAALIGFLFFAEIPRPQVFAGATVIIAACLWSAQGEKAKPPAGATPMISE